jgi:hypothetical protein
MRIARAIWVFLTNSSAVYYLYLGTRNATALHRLLEQPAKNRVEWFHFALLAFVPFLGMLLEVVDSRFAKWLNIGYGLFSAYSFPSSLFGTGPIIVPRLS